MPTRDGCLSAGGTPEETSWRGNILPGAPNSAGQGLRPNRQQSQRPTSLDEQRKMIPLYHFYRLREHAEMVLFQRKRLAADQAVHLTRGVNWNLDRLPAGARRRNDNDLAGFCERIRFARDIEIAGLLHLDVLTVHPRTAEDRSSSIDWITMGIATPRMSYPLHTTRQAGAASEGESRGRPDM